MGGRVTCSSPLENQYGVSPPICLFMYLPGYLCRYAVLRQLPLYQSACTARRRAEQR
jgi:hypothetical protein